jgi:hypothetical protein
MKLRRARHLFFAATSLWLLAPALHAPARAADAQAVRRELAGHYTEYGRLLKQEHRYPVKQHFLKYTTEDFVLKEGGRTVNREDAAEQMEEGPMAVARFTRYDVKIISLTLKGDQAVVVYRDSAAGTLPDAHGTSHRLVVTSTTRDTWVKTDEGWLTRLSEILASKIYVDGKELKAKSQGGRRSR